MNTSSLFELVAPLPDPRIDKQSQGLVGFEARYATLRKDLTLLLEPDELEAWSKRRHHKILPICEVLAQRYPLVIFHGDVGTGKTATAEGVASRMARELRREATLYKLSTRVRGTGLHGEMSRLIGDAFDEVVAGIGKKRLGFLLIDEADAVASSRGTLHSHQEEKAGTNTLIQKVDDVRKHGGRFVVFLATNRLRAVDPAVTRRAAQVVAFLRPDEKERRELLAADLSGIGLTEAQLDRLVEATGPSDEAGRPHGFTFSDLRTRLLPAAVLDSFPDRPLTFETLMSAARSTPATPPFETEAHV